MNQKEKIIIVFLIIAILILSAALYFMINYNSDNEIKTINNTTNSTSKVVNTTLVDESNGSSSQESYSDVSEPEYGSDEYVDRWDQSQQSDNDDWSYLHDQPVKTENGHEYKRMYDEDSGESYWYQMDQDYDEDEYLNN